MVKVLYLVWTKVNTEKEQEWEKYIDTVHIPEMIDTKKFISARRCKVVEGDSPGKYLTIYECENEELLNSYLHNDADRLRKDHVDHFGSHASSSRIILEESFSRSK